MSGALLTTSLTHHLVRGTPRSEVVGVRIYAEWLTLRTFLNFDSFNSHIENTDKCKLLTTHRHVLDSRSTINGRSPCHDQPLNIWCLPIFDLSDLSVNWNFQRVKIRMADVESQSVVLLQTKKRVSFGMALLHVIQRKRTGYTYDHPYLGFMRVSAYPFFMYIFHYFNPYIWLTQNSNRCNLNCTLQYNCMLYHS